MATRQREFRAHQALVQHTIEPQQERPEECSPSSEQILGSFLEIVFLTYEDFGDFCQNDDGSPCFEFGKVVVSLLESKRSVFFHPFFFSLARMADFRKMRDDA